MWKCVYQLNNNYENMNKIKIINDKTKVELIPMSEMEPWQVGRITMSYLDNGEGAIVMRTALSDKFEVMDMSDPGSDQCWDKLICKGLMVKLLPSATITINLNE